MHRNRCGGRQKGWNIEPLALLKIGRSKTIGIHQGFNGCAITKCYGAKGITRLYYINAPAVRRRAVGGRNSGRGWQWGRGKSWCGKRSGSACRSGRRVRSRVKLLLRAKEESDSYSKDNEGNEGYTSDQLVSSSFQFSSSETGLFCRKGRSTKKVVPTPRVLSTQMRPP